MYRFTAVLLLISSTVFSQNYVVNGSFERQPKGVPMPPEECAFSGGPDVFDVYAEGWQTYNCMTPDLLIRSNDSSACPWMPEPRTGKRMVGLIMYHPAADGLSNADYHELIQGTLAKPLEPGKTYRVRFRTRTVDTLGRRHLEKVYGTIHNIQPVHCGNFGFYFSKDKINVYENYFYTRLDFPIHPQINHERIVETPDGAWTTISMLFKADQPFRYFLFGNFAFDVSTPVNLGDNDNTLIEQNNRSTNSILLKIKRIAYYCFDDFVIEEYKDSDLANTLLEQQKLSFNAELLFDVDRSELKPDALNALKQLAETLLSMTDQRVEIGGHTDNSGSEAHNLDLSEQRAKAVWQYLIEAGVPDTQLSWKGYGENRPVTTNDTAAGRQQNRRVECSIVPGG